MWTVIIRTLKNRKVSLIVFTISGILLLWMYVALFPSFANMADSMKEYMESFPEGFMKAFGMEDLDMSTIEKFLATEQYSFVWPILMLFFVSSLAGAGLAGEVEKGTSEILLSRPISRVKLYWSRYIAGAIMIVIFTVLSILFVVPLCEIHNVDYILVNNLTMTIAGFLFGLAVFSIAMFLSAWFSEKGKVYMITGGLLVAMYVINIVSAIKESLSDTKYLSFFYYFKPNEAIIRNTISNSTLWVFLIIIVVFAIGGAYIFNKRDIKTV